MNRRDVLRLTTMGGAASLPWLLGGPGVSPRSAEADDKPAAAKKLNPLKITDVKTILTAPAKIRLVVVKVQTSEPDLYGLGCATFTQRARVVETAINKFLKPFLIGKDPAQIEDVWQSAFVSSYWRNGPVLNNAISGVDMALWDILGNAPNMPVYQLFGGKCRKAVDVYRHASRPHGQGGRGDVPQVHGAGLSRTCACRSACRATRRTASASGKIDEETPVNAGRRRGSRGRTCASCRSCLSTCASRSATRSSCSTTCTSACRRSWR